MLYKISNRFNGSTVFEAETCTFKECVELAVSKKINLSWANLAKANLSEANLSEADLSGADLSKANLSKANLPGANLSGANLYEANLSGANLSGANLSEAFLSNADLSEADLYNTIGNGKEIKTIQTEKYIVNYTKDAMQIGCENHKIEEWFEFEDERILDMDGEYALRWWRKHGPALKILIGD